MTRCFAAALAALIGVTAPAPAGEPVTSKDVPPPGPAQARLWLEAALQAPWLECCDPSFPRSEPARMLAAVRRDAKLGQGVGWYDPSRRRHDWSWLAARADADADGRVTREEFAAPAESFARLDRDRDGAITAEDLDWSERSAWVRQDAQALRLLRAIDGDGNGRLNEKEWLAYFRRLADEKDYLTSEDLRDVLGEERGRGAKKVSRAVWQQCLIAGDLGSPFPGPRVGQAAPDFTLPTHDGKGRVTLSEFRGKKPVVLIFGSFT